MWLEMVTFIHTMLKQNCRHDYRLNCLCVLLPGNVVWLDKVTSIRAMLKLSTSRDDTEAAEMRKKEEREKDGKEGEKKRGEKKEKRGREAEKKKKELEKTHEGKVRAERGCSSVGRASDRHAAHTGSISWCGTGFFSQSQLSAQTLLQFWYTPICSTGVH